ncbi:hypothetical protein Ddc_17310 [Ditylenchus destructor]|nr:hypothetical protein Ddc_17310 [Ditylenchus destructor]
MVISGYILLSIAFFLTAFLDAKLTPQEETKLYNLIIQKVHFPLGPKTKVGQTHIQRFNDDFKSTPKAMVLYLQMIDNLNVSHAWKYCHKQIKEKVTEKKPVAVGGKNSEEHKKQELEIKESGEEEALKHQGIAVMESFAVRKPIADGGKYTTEQKTHELECFVSRLHFVKDLLVLAKSLNGATVGDDIHKAYDVIERYIEASDPEVKAKWEFHEKKENSVPFYELFEIFEVPKAMEPEKQQKESSESNEKEAVKQDSELHLPCLMPRWIFAKSVKAITINVIESGKSVLKSALGTINDKIDAAANVKQSNESSLMHELVFFFPDVRYHGVELRVYAETGCATPLT